MWEEDRPVVLVVCEETQRASALRAVLRDAGLYAARSPTLEAALRLITQVRVDGCVVCQPMTAEEAQRLGSALDGSRAASTKVCLAEDIKVAPPGWTLCSEADLSEAARRLFQPSIEPEDDW